MTALGPSNLSNKKARKKTQSFVKRLAEQHKDRSATKKSRSPSDENVHNKLEKVNEFHREHSLSDDLDLTPRADTFADFSSDPASSSSDCSVISVSPENQAESAKATSIAIPSDNTKALEEESCNNALIYALTDGHESRSLAVIRQNIISILSHAILKPLNKIDEKTLSKIGLEKGNFIDFLGETISPELKKLFFLTIYDYYKTHHESANKCEVEKGYKIKEYFGRTQRILLKSWDLDNCNAVEHSINTDQIYKKQPADYLKEIFNSYADIKLKEDRLQFLTEHFLGLYTIYEPGVLMDSLVELFPKVYYHDQLILNYYFQLILCVDNDDVLLAEKSFDKQVKKFRDLNETYLIDKMGIISAECDNLNGNLEHINKEKHERYSNIKFQNFIGVRLLLQSPVFASLDKNIIPSLNELEGYLEELSRPYHQDIDLSKTYEILAKKLSDTFLLYYRQINITDFKKKKEYCSSQYFIRESMLFNQLAFFLIDFILKKETLSEKANTMTQLIKLATVCKERGHFIVAMVITSVFSRAPIHRLKPLYSNFPLAINEELKALETLFSAKNNFKNLRNAMSDSPIGMINLLKKDIDKLAESDPMSTGRALYLLYVSQQILCKDVSLPYFSLSTVYLLNNAPDNEDRLYDRSLEVFPPWYEINEDLKRCDDIHDNLANDLSYRFSITCLGKLYSYPESLYCLGDFLFKVGSLQGKFSEKVERNLISIEEQAAQLSGEIKDLASKIEDLNSEKATSKSGNEKKSQVDQLTKKLTQKKCEKKTLQARIYYRTVFRAQHHFEKMSSHQESSSLSTSSYAFDPVASLSHLNTELNDLAIDTPSSSMAPINGSESKSANYFVDSVGRNSDTATFHADPNRDHPHPKQSRTPLFEKSKRSSSPVPAQKRQISRTTTMLPRMCDDHDTNNLAPSLTLKSRKLG